MWNTTVYKVSSHLVVRCLTGFYHHLRRERYCVVEGEEKILCCRGKGRYCMVEGRGTNVAVDERWEYYTVGGIMVRFISLIEVQVSIDWFKFVWS